MCGICGMVSGAANQAVDPERVAAMTAALEHRGPDEGGVWEGAGAAIGARRLKVIDLDGGQQPMVTGDGRFVLAFNGEIYNAPDLRNELAAKGVQFDGASDTEVLLRCIETWGDAAVARLNGMFAYAVYDTEQRRVTLVRDRLGIKPLYVLESRGALVFASELDAILRSGFVSGVLDPASIDAFFTYLYVPAPETIFAEVTQLLPGERLIYENGSVRRERYWTPECRPDSGWTLDSAAERYRELLSDAVHMQQISDVPLGAFLSGGMDSSCIVAAMSETSGRPVQTFTIGFQDPTADESQYAQAVADRFGTDHTCETLDPDPVRDLPQLVPHFGQPFADSSLIATWMVSKLARESVTVVLSGDGGDELFAGYSWLHMTLRGLRYAQTPDVLRRIAGSMAGMLPNTPYTEKLKRFNADSFLSAMEIFRRRQSCFYTEERRRLFRKPLRQAIERTNRDRFAGRWRALDAGSDADTMLMHDLQQYLPDDVLAKVDRMSMAASLEARVPLLDHRMVEFAGSLPFELKYANGVSKRVVKRAYAEMLPPAVTDQRKRGFALPVNRWFRENLVPYVQETVLASDAKIARWLDMAEVQRVWDDHRSGRRDLGHRLFALLVFEMWLRYVENYIDSGLE